MWPFHRHSHDEYVGRSLHWNGHEFIVITKCKCGKVRATFEPVTARDFLKQT